MFLLKSTKSNSMAEPSKKIREDMIFTRWMDTMPWKTGFFPKRISRSWEMVSGTDFSRRKTSLNVCLARKPGSEKVFSGENFQGNRNPPRDDFHQMHGYRVFSEENLVPEKWSQERIFLAWKLPSMSFWRGNLVPRKFSVEKTFKETGIPPRRTLLLWKGKRSAASRFPAYKQIFALPMVCRLQEIEHMA